MGTLWWTLKFDGVYVHQSLCGGFPTKIRSQMEIQAVSVATRVYKGATSGYAGATKPSAKPGRHPQTKPKSVAAKLNPLAPEHVLEMPATFTQLIHTNYPPGPPPPTPSPQQTKWVAIFPEVWVNAENAPEAPLAPLRLPPGHTNLAASPRRCGSPQRRR